MPKSDITTVSRQAGYRIEKVVRRPGLGGLTVARGHDAGSRPGQRGGGAPVNAAAFDYRVDGAPFAPDPLWRWSLSQDSVDWNLRAILVASGGQVVEAFRQGERCGYLDREQFEAHQRAAEAEPKAPPAIGFVSDDGGRSAAGYRGHTGDCGTRAAAIATSVPYREVYDQINRLARDERPRGRKRRSHARTGVWPKTLGRFLEEYGFTWVPTMGIGTGTTVHLRADELPAGRLVCRVSKHFTAVIDGVIHDTHDPSRDGTRAVYGYWIKETPQT